MLHNISSLCNVRGEIKFLIAVVVFVKLGQKVLDPKKFG